MNRQGYSKIQSMSAVNYSLTGDGRSFFGSISCRQCFYVNNLSQADLGYPAAVFVERALKDIASSADVWLVE